MRHNIHEGRILVGLLAMSALAVIGFAVWIAWWIPFVLVGLYAVAYAIGAVVIRVFDL